MLLYHEPRTHGDAACYTPSPSTKLRSHVRARRRRARAGSLTSVPPNKTLVTLATYAPSDIYNRRRARGQPREPRVDGCSDTPRTPASERGTLLLLASHSLTGTGMMALPARRRGDRERGARQATPPALGRVSSRRSFRRRSLKASSSSFLIRRTWLCTSSTSSCSCSCCCRSLLLPAAPRPAPCSFP